MWISPEELRQMYSVPEVAEMLGVTAPTIHNWATSGKLKGYRIGSRLKFKKEDVQAFVKPAEVQAETVAA